MNIIEPRIINGDPASMTDRELLIELVTKVRDLEASFVALIESAKDNPFLRSFLK